jgi:hypothetical protein
MRMLNEHPQLHVINETHWIPKLYELYGLGHARVAAMLAVVDATHHVDGRPTTPLSPAQRNALLAIPGDVTIREFADALATGIARASGKAVWADKTPDYVTHMALIQSVWPECKFIHMIRNGAHVAQSMANHAGYRALVATGETSWPAISYRAPDMRHIKSTGSLDAFLRLWRLRVEGGQAAAQDLSQHAYLEVRYEALLAEPRSELERITSFAGLSGPDESWITVAASQVEAKHAPSRSPHMVTQQTDRQAVALMESLGYRTSLAWGASGDGRV